MKRLLFFMVLIIGIVGCTPTELDAPTIVLESEGLITWRLDPKATHYVVKVNDHEDRVAFNRYDFRWLTNGTYTIQVRSENGQVSSPFSNILTVTVNNIAISPSHLVITDGLLYFESIEDAIGYELFIDGTFIDQYLNNQIDLTHLTIGFVYKIQVKTVYKNKQADASEPYIYFNFDGPSETHSITVTELDHGWIPIKIPQDAIIEYVIYEGQLLTLSSFMLQGDQVLINYDLVSTVDEFPIIFQCYSANMRIDYFVTIRI